jgi:hypothetical protein
MPAKSKKQQMAAGAALSAKRGEIPKSKLKGASKEMAGSMSEKQLREMAATPRKSLPRKKSATKAGPRSRSGGGAPGQKRAAGKRSASRSSTRKR